MGELIQLSSNVIYENNTLAEFTTPIEKSFFLEECKYVGIKEISYTKSWFNVLYDCKILLHDEYGRHYSINDTHYIYNEHEYMISAGYYETAQILVDAINEILNKYNLSKNPKLHYNKYNNMVSIELGKTEDDIKIIPYFGIEIENLLGLTNRNPVNEYYNTNNAENISEIVFQNSTIYRDDYFKAYHPVEITGGIHSLYVYTDIVYPSSNGDGCSPILRTVEIPPQYKFTEQVTIGYANPQYRRILINGFNSITISIKDDSGCLIPFKFGRVLMTLDFKKYI